MNTRYLKETGLDSFEGEGGARAGKAELKDQQTLEGKGRIVPTNGGVSWHVRPAFLAELDAVLETRERSEAEATKEKNESADLDEEFAQGFQELLETQVIPHFESVAALLAKRSYPVEVRVSGKRGERTCFLAVAGTKEGGNWALYGGAISGPRMVISSNVRTRRVFYKANFRDGAPHDVQSVMRISDVTDSFLEQELRQLFLSLRGANQSPAKSPDEASTFIKAVSKACC